MHELELSGCDELRVIELVLVDEDVGVRRAVAAHTTVELREGQPCRRDALAVTTIDFATSSAEAFGVELASSLLALASLEKLLLELAACKLRRAVPDVCGGVCGLRAFPRFPARTRRSTMRFPLCARPRKAHTGFEPVLPP